jgi:hypothetical protein
MLTLVLWAQLSVSQRSPDSVYSTSALRDLVAAAAAANHRPPAELKGYRSHIETELALILRDTLGREHAAEVEQLATDATWTRTDRYSLHVIGYRSQNVGVPYSTLSIVRGWTIPTLFGERLALGAYIAGRNRRDTLLAVHPFAADREQYYRYSGGDTVTVLRVGERQIPIARIRVRPEFTSRTPLGAFDGEIDVDAVRHQIIRMRGQIEILGGESRSGSRLMRLTGVVSAAYVEFVNAEVGGKYWLPALQRTEFQASFPLLGQTRAIFRIISNISNIAVDESAETRDTTGSLRVTVTWAPSDSIGRFSDWRREIGAESEAGHGDDFEDVAPDAWRRSGPARLSLFPNSLRRVFRFNRVEGLYLGVAPTIDFRSAWPGLSAGAFGGWAFSENTARGGAFAVYTHGRSTLGVRAERSLASTNDFALPMEEDPGFAALFASVDNYDYVDQRLAAVSISRTAGVPNTGRATVQLGFGEDRPAAARVGRGLILRGASFRPNRGVLEGSYALGSIELELHPDVTGDYLSPGVGARVRYEIGRGQLNWRRMELALSTRHYRGNFSFGAHVDAGAVRGAPLPPQQLFELGGTDLLPGYDYKQFAGDEAALFRAFASYRFGLWKRPMRAWQGFFIPGPNPGLEAGIQGGWARASSPAALESIRLLGVDQYGNAISMPTGNVRSTAGLGLSFFSDLFHVGVARPVDRAAPWRLVAGFGTRF